jgi:hypothetical protein
MGPVRPNLRRTIGLFYANGMLWAVGNALTSGTLLLYLAMDLGAKGVALSLILAAPALAGVLRLFTPWVIRVAGGIRPACLIPFTASYVLILGQPLFGLPRVAKSPYALASLVALVCVHQLLEYVGQACLLAWIGQSVPGRLRGRFFARRQILQLALTIPTLLLAGWFADTWRSQFGTSDQAPRLLGYAIPTAIGVLFLLSSLIPLQRLPTILPARVPSAEPPTLIMEPLTDVRFRGLLIYGCWVALANGLTQSAQNIYPKAVLGLGVLPMAVFRTTMQIGQMGYSNWAGGFSDRFGNRPVMVLSQALVSLGPVFFLLATPAFPWWALGAWLCWSAFAGLNVGLPSYMLKISRRECHAAYVASYFGITNVVYAICTVCGGVAHDRLAALAQSIHPGAPTADHFAWQFAAGFVLRALGVVFLVRLMEPGAWRWTGILSEKVQRTASQPQVVEADQGN